jgi:MFS transporter, LPLT family, lysophospholipid transporter
VLVMLTLYGLLLFFGASTNTVIVLFGLFVAGTMVLVMLRHRLNLAAGDLAHLIASDRVEPTAGR